MRLFDLSKLNFGEKAQKKEKKEKKKEDSLPKLLTMRDRIAGELQREPENNGEIARPKRAVKDYLPMQITSNYSNTPIPAPSKTRCFHSDAPVATLQLFPPGNNSNGNGSVLVMG